MNHERMLALADYIEKETVFSEDDCLYGSHYDMIAARWRKPRFNMVRFGLKSNRSENSSLCGTCACIAGSAVALFDGPKMFQRITWAFLSDDPEQVIRPSPDDPNQGIGFYQRAQKHLGLTGWQANNLFAHDFTQWWTIEFAHDNGFTEFRPQGRTKYIYSQPVLPTLPQKWRQLRSAA